jgi:hypothetical protein
VDPFLFGEPVPPELEARFPRDLLRLPRALDGAEEGAEEVSRGDGASRSAR